MDNQETHRYDDIINLPHPTSKTHPRMPLYNRATQFSPFAALTGHDAAIAETARRTDEKHQLSEDTIAELNEKAESDSRDHWYQADSNNNLFCPGFEKVRRLLRYLHRRGQKN